MPVSGENFGDVAALATKPDFLTGLYKPTRMTKLEPACGENRQVSERKCCSTHLPALGTGVGLGCYCCQQAAGGLALPKLPLLGSMRFTMQMGIFQ